MNDRPTSENRYFVAIDGKKYHFSEGPDCPFNSIVGNYCRHPEGGDKCDVLNKRKFSCPARIREEDL